METDQWSAMPKFNGQVSFLTWPYSFYGPTGWLSQDVFDDVSVDIG